MTSEAEKIGWRPSVTKQQGDRFVAGPVESWDDLDDDIPF